MEEKTKRYTLFGQNTQIGQYIEFPNGTSSAPGYLLSVGFPGVKVLEAGKVIFEGNVILRLKSEPKPGSIAVFARLMGTFIGSFDFAVDADLKIAPTHATLTTNKPIVSANIQPYYPPNFADSKLSIDSQTGEVILS